MTESPKRKTHAFLEQDAGSITAPVGLSKLSVQEIHEIRLLLRGDSVVDWYRLALRGEEDARRRVAEARALVEELDPAPSAESAGTQDG